MADSESPDPIRSLDDLAKAFCAARSKFKRRPWFRGHRDEQWPLRSRIHRILADSGWHHTHEVSLVQQFRARAPLRYPNCPSDDDDFGWLSLMRHHGLPTRLLDWTESILVAAYFAVSGKAKEHPPALWALDPHALNASQKIARHPVSPRQRHVAHLAEEAFSGGKAWTSIVTVIPPETDLRMLVQHATFTIHGTHYPLEQKEYHERFLMKLSIAGDYRVSLRKELDYLGVNEAALFPSLEPLAKGIEESESAPADFKDFQS